MKPLIHIVEDDSAIRESLKLMLETRGYEVEAFADGAALLEHRDNARCACLILDVNLPGDDGFGVLAKLRAAGFDTPAIFMSGRASLQMRDKAQAANALAFFAKPVAPVELLGAIARATAHT
ncbi:MAG: response regulator [Alphaproteobacteria bacterium]|nr:response regulator [Alphaproteobacteria bacterium]